MKLELILNNYQVGGPLQLEPTEKIILKERIDKYHTKVVFEGLTEFQRGVVIKRLAGNKLYRVKEYE